MEALGHTTLQGFQAKFNLRRNSQYRAFHTPLDALMMDVLKKAAESRRNVGLDSNAKEEEEVDGPCFFVQSWIKG